MYWFGVAALKRTANGLRAQRTPISHLGRPGGANTSHLWSNFISSFSNFHPACLYVASFHFSTLPIFSQNIFTVFNQSLLLLLHTFILSSLGLMRHFFKIFVILLSPPLVTYFDKRTIWHPNNLAPGQHMQLAFVCGHFGQESGRQVLKTLLQKYLKGGKLLEYSCQHLGCE